jgi:hypothetical protein
MKLNTISIRQKKVIIFVLLCFIIALIFVIYFNAKIIDNTTAQNDTSDDINYDEPTKEEIDSGAATKSDSMANENLGNKSDVVITSTNLSADSKVLHIRSYINNLDSTAKCYLDMTKDIDVYHQEKNVQTSANISVCTGFDVNLSDLSSGNWKIIISYKGSSINGSSYKYIEIK